VGIEFGFSTTTTNLRHIEYLKQFFEDEPETLLDNGCPRALPENRHEQVAKRQSTSATRLIIGGQPCETHPAT
jgi:hypothetical protein